MFNNNNKKERGREREREGGGGGGERSIILPETGNRERRDAVPAKKINKLQGKF